MTIGPAKSVIAQSYVEVTAARSVAELVRAKDTSQAASFNFIHDVLKCACDGLARSLEHMEEADDAERKMRREMQELREALAHHVPVVNAALALCYKYDSDGASSVQDIKSAIDTLSSALDTIQHVNTA